MFVICIIHIRGFFSIQFILSQNLEDFQILNTEYLGGVGIGKEVTGGAIEHCWRPKGSRKEHQLMVSHVLCFVQFCLTSWHFLQYLSICYFVFYSIFVQIFSETSFLNAKRFRSIFLPKLWIQLGHLLRHQIHCSPHLLPNLNVFKEIFPQREHFICKILHKLQMLVDFSIQERICSISTWAHLRGSEVSFLWKPAQSR